MLRPIQITETRAYKLARKHRWKLLIAGVLLVLGLAGSACSAVPGTDDYNDKHGQGDAGVDDRDDSKADVINMPDGFPNAAHKCDGHGHRVFVTTQNASGKELVVIDDPSCGGAG